MSQRAVGTIRECALEDQATLDCFVLRRFVFIGIPCVGDRVVPESLWVIRAVVAGLEHVLVNPAYSGGIGAQLRADIGRQLPGDKVELFENGELFFLWASSYSRLSARLGRFNFANMFF